MPKNPVLTPEDIENWKRKINPDTGKRYTQADIARMYGVTRSYVSWVKTNRARTYSKTPREAVMEHFPWSVGRKFHEAPQNKRLRDHAEYMETGGRGMSHNKLKRLLSFYNFLEEENVVVEFDPTIPPYEGCSTGGFTYRPRQDSDGDLIIRVNEYTTLTDKGRIIWRFPPRKPLVG